MTCFGKFGKPNFHEKQNFDENCFFMICPFVKIWLAGFAKNARIREKHVIFPNLASFHGLRGISRIAQVFE